MPKSCAPYGVRQIANWILDYTDELGVNVTNMALNKLIYFAFEGYLKRTNTALTNAKIEAWDHGPVFREIYKAFKEFGNNKITKRATLIDIDTLQLREVKPNLDATDEALLKDILQPYIRLPASVLRELSHAKGGAWDKVWWHREDTNPGMEITPDAILSSTPEVRFKT